MLPYWLLFLVPAFAALSERSSGLLRSRFAFSWLLIWSLLTVLIGFRYQVGGDWGSYQRIFRYSSFLTFDEALLRDDPGYILLNWFAAKAGYDIALVNVVCAAVFAWGLVPATIPTRWRGRVLPGLSRRGCLGTTSRTLQHRWQAIESVLRQWQTPLQR